MKSTAREDLWQCTLPDRRRLAWYEHGDPHGSVIFAFHGLPGSRLQIYPDESIARAAGARVIHVDRPGFGRSDPAPGRSLADWASDIRKLADHLQVERFAVAGVSGGGPFACACAAELGDLVTRAAIVSGIGPPGSMQASKSWVVRVGFAAAASTPWLITLPLTVAARVGKHAPGFFLDLLGESLPTCDRAILSRPEVRTILVRDLSEAFRNGPRGFLQDLQLEARPWKVPFQRISCPVALWHGLSDTIVPPTATEALAALIPHASVRIFPQAGHFLVYEIWRDLLRWLLGACVT